MELSGYVCASLYVNCEGENDGVGPGLSRRGKEDCVRNSMPNNFGMEKKKGQRRKGRKKMNDDGSLRT